jgi:hypothetical protein
MACFISVFSFHVDGEVNRGRISLDAGRSSGVSVVSFFTSAEGVGGSAWKALWAAWLSAWRRLRRMEGVEPKACAADRSLDWGDRWSLGETGYKEGGVQWAVTDMIIWETPSGLIMERMEACAGLVYSYSNICANNHELIMSVQDPSFKISRDRSR